jgi:hypothetical protein
VRVTSARQALVSGHAAGAWHDWVKRAQTPDERLAWG